MKKSIRSIGIVPLVGLIGCSASEPSSDALQAVIADKVNQKGCATSVLFSRFPIDDQNKVNRNRDIVDALIQVGLVKNSNGEVQLTAEGQKFYNASRSGFCYTSGYDIKDVNVESTGSDLPSQVAGAWTVSFTVVPKDVASWALDENLMALASIRSNKNLSQNSEHKIRLIQKKGSEDLMVSDPRFSFNPDITFNMGW